MITIKTPFLYNSPNFYDISKMHGLLQYFSATKLCMKSKQIVADNHQAVFYLPEEEFEASKLLESICPNHS